MILRNNSPGTRVFNIAGGAPGVVLQYPLKPGEVADLTLAEDPAKDFALKAWFDSKEVEEVGEKELKGVAGGFDSDELEKAHVQLAEAQETIARLTAARQAAELDQNRRTPPRQFGADGGPNQSPTVDGQGGALTPSQEEKGRPELPPEAAAKVVQERHAAMAKATDEKAKADAAKAKK